VQGETQENLKRLQQENTEQLARLREEHSRITKEFETLKYSGEARNTSNQRMLAEFEQHLTDSQNKLKAVQDAEAVTSKLLVDVKAGIDHLSDKLEKLKAVRSNQLFSTLSLVPFFLLSLFTLLSHPSQVQFRSAANVCDKLTEAELRLVNLHEEVEARKSELGNVTIAEVSDWCLLCIHSSRPASHLCCAA
jgi:DNA repair exonuclease SbcCD ATPase subunit